MSEPIRVVKTTHKKDKPKDKDLAFGNVFTDHMFVANFEEEKGWYDPRVEPYGPFPLDPATAVLHYGQSLFDGLKAFRGVRREDPAVPAAEARGAAQPDGPADDASRPSIPS